jgi:hypothetical protein
MDQGERKRQPGEGAFGILMLLLGLGFLWQAYEISGFTALSAPGTVPMAASAAMVIAALLVVARDLRRPSEQNALGERARAFAAQITPSIVVVFAGFVIGYAGLLDTLGFLPASLLFLFTAIHFLERRSPAFSLLVSLGSLVAIYAVFRLIFQVVLPEGLVPEREIIAWLEGLFTARGPEQ